MTTTVLECGIYLTSLDENNIPVISCNTEKMISLVEKIVPYHNTKPAVTLTSDYTGYSNVHTEVLLPMFAGNQLLFYNNQLLVAMNLRDMESDFGILPAPKFDEAQEEYINSTNRSWITFITVPVTNPDTDMTGTVLDACGYYSQQIVTPAYIETTVKNKTLRDNDSAEMLGIILSTRHYDLSHYYKWGGIYDLPNNLVKSKSTDFASRFATISVSTQKEIDKTLDAIG